MMKVSRLSLCLCVAVGAISFVPLAAATEPTARSPESQLKVIPQIDFKGGKVRDLIELLREQTGGNIVAGPGVDDFPLPELKLRNVTLTAAVNAISVATGGVVRVDANRAGPNLGDIITLQTDSVPKPAGAESDVIFRAFLLPVAPSDSVDLQEKRLASLIHRSIEFYNQARPGKPALPVPTLEGHRETHMLLVAGPRESVAIIAQVLAASTGRTDTVDVEGEKVSAVKVTILGEVQKPGVYSVDDASVAQLLGLAGGTTNQGDAKRISVLSKDGSKTSVKFTAGPTSSSLREGDVVTVPQKLIGMQF